MFRLLGTKTYNIYKQFATEKASLEMGGFICPFPKCGVSFISKNQNLEFKTIQCVGCTYYFCIYCKSNPVACQCKPNLALEVSSQSKNVNNINNKNSNGTNNNNNDNYNHVFFKGDNNQKTGAHFVSITVNNKSKIGDNSMLIQVRDDNYIGFFKTLIVERIDQISLNAKDIRLICGGKDIPNSSKISDYSFSTNTNVNAVLTVDTNGSNSCIAPQLPLTNQQEDLNSRSSLEFIKKYGKQCPNCLTPIIHFYGEGCHHISPYTNGCPNCHFHFCYICLKPWLKHPTGCPIFCNNKCKCPKWEELN
jgi:hypothetical protein